MAFEQICEGTAPPPRQLARWAALFEQRFAWCRARGATYVTLIVPERHVIYDDKLPTPYRPAADRAAVRLLAALDPALRAAVLYPEAALRAARQQGEVFFRTDEHINPRGSYACYRSVLDHVREHVPIVPVMQDDLVVSSRHLTGNLGIRLDDEPGEKAELWRVAEFGGAARVFQTEPPLSRVEVFHHRDPALPKAVVFGDSNLFSLWHFLVPHFSRLVLVHDTQRMFHDLVASERADLVLNLMSETKLGNLAANGTAVLPTDTDIADFQDHCGGVLPAAPPAPLLSIDFAVGGNSAGFVREGWGEPEFGHTWMVDLHSVLAFPAGMINGATVLEIELTPNARVPQRLILSLGDGENWETVASLTIEASRTQRMSLLQMMTKRARYMRFEHPDGCSPSTDGIGTDTRVLSFAMRHVAVFR